MATRRSEIQVEVLGLDQLRQLNTALGAHDRRLQALTATYINFNAAVTAANPQLQRFGNTFVTVNNTVNNVNRSLTTTNNNIVNMGNSANRAGGQFGGMLGVMLKYRAVSLVFEGVQKSIGAVVQTMYDMERQAARVQRVSAPGSTPGIRADFAVEAARTGADIKDIGEAYYQLKTRISDNATAFSALQTAMNLVVGTEADARQTTRAMLQVYAQFGDQLDKNVGQSENFRRIGELLAGTWKLADAEMVDITNTLKYLGPIAEAAKVPLEQVFGTIAALTAEGHRGRMSGTEAGQFISQIIKNYNAATGMIENKGAKVKVAFTTEGGIDLQKTIQNIVDTANRLPAAQARAFLLAISGSQNSFRFLGTTGVEFMRLLNEAIGKARDQAHGLTHDAEDIRKTMMTTAQEGQRAFGGMFAFISTMVDASPLRGWLRGIADDIQHAAEVARREVNTQQTGGAVLGGQGFGVNPADNRRAQLLMQQSLLRGMLSESGGLSGNVLINPYGRGFGMLQDYASKTAPEKGYLQQFMDLRNERPVIGGNVRVNIAAMQAELARVTAEIARAGTHPIGPANPFGPGLTTRPGSLPGFGPAVGSYTDPKIEEARKELERKQEDARKSLLEKTKSQLSAAEADLEIKQKLYPTVGGRVDQRVSGQAQMVDLLKKSVASLTEDPLDRATELKKLKYGIGTAREKIDEEVAQQKEKLAENLKRENEDKSKEHAAFLEYYAEVARTKYGIFSPEAKQRAEQAQSAAESLASGIDLQKLKDHATGPMKEFLDAQKEAWDKFVESGKDGEDKIREARAKQEKNDQSYADRISNRTDATIRARELGLRPNMLGGGVDARQEAALSANITDIQQALDLLRKNTPDAAEQIDRMAQRLAEANAALTDFHDTLDQKAYSKRVQAEQDAYDLRNQEINHLHRLKFYKDEGAAEKDTVRKLSELVGSAEQNLADVKGINSGNLSDTATESRRKAEKELLEARQNLTDYQIESKLQRYQNVYGNVKENVHGAFMDYFHGRGDLGNVAERIGGSIVDAALDAQIKRFADPLVQTVTAEILAIQGNTDALMVLNTTMGGGASGGGSLSSLASGGLGAVVAAGVGVGIAEAGGAGLTPGGAEGTASGAAGRSGGAYKQSDLQKGLGAGLAAYSIGATAAQQGVNAGNLLGGIATGASIGAAFGGAGALIGGAVGGLVDIVGGLFHHSSKPTAAPQDLNPAYYNAPSAFDVAAYNYSAYGKLPRMQDVGFNVTPRNVPIVNVFVDGAKVAARQEITRQTTLATVSLTNPNMDRHSPV